MPPKKESCEQCGRVHIECPDCGGNTVSVDAITTNWGSLSPDFSDFAIYGEVGEVVKYNIACWDCEYSEERAVKIVEGLQPCGSYHPLPCGLDEECPIPVDYFDAEKNSREIYEEWMEDHAEEEENHEE